MNIFVKKSTLECFTIHDTKTKLKDEVVTTVIFDKIAKNQTYRLNFVFKKHLARIFVLVVLSIVNLKNVAKSRHTPVAISKIGLNFIKIA